MRLYSAIQKICCIVLLGLLNICHEAAADEDVYFSLVATNYETGNTQALCLQGTGDDLKSCEVYKVYREGIPGSVFADISVHSYKKARKVDSGEGKSSTQYAVEVFYAVHLHFTAAGAASMSKYVEDNIGRKIALVVGDKVISVARILSPLSGNVWTLQDNYSQDQANELAARIRIVLEKIQQQHGS